MRRNSWTGLLIESLSSLRLTLACLCLLMVLVTLCTLAQVSLGIHVSVDRFIRSFVVWWAPAGSSLRLPVFPGGGFVGIVLLLNLVFAQFRRLEFSRRKGGLWLVHVGLALLFVGEFAAALFQVESEMAIAEGQTKTYSEDYRRLELVASDTTDKAYDDERAIPDSLLKLRREIAVPSLPFVLKVRAYHENAALTMRRPDDPPAPATTRILFQGEGKTPRLPLAQGLEG